ncbi:nuclear transport factor 2 family protein [Amycolatopsis sp. 195334CR]|uniref:nuclear transport factor 2 family protein n=1 Tax=Amycolatopsis sp. 195334CR TaxID=2814588 RepID=UPI001A8E6C71|nr:nuclear transport factor 2 family protein [Amycolatopsis sp. 195334CR]MBN6038044.1 nuclear transport factor 2 family protein [Amycolatopsis sp. 195334CR]
MTLLPLLRDRDEAGLAALLADDVRFHSPVADYAGRADVAHLFGLISGVLRKITPDREVGSWPHVTTFFSSGGLRGVLDERYDSSDHLVEATLMLRPLSLLQQKIAEMGAALRATPLPSARP